MQENPKLLPSVTPRACHQHVCSHLSFHVINCGVHHHHHLPLRHCSLSLSLDLISSFMLLVWIIITSYKSKALLLCSFVVVNRLELFGCGFWGFFGNQPNNGFVELGAELGRATGKFSDDGVCLASIDLHHWLWVALQYVQQWTYGR